MSIFDRIVEEKIQAAMEAGRFDNLPGKGKPLKLDENPFTPQEWRTAFHLLKNNGFAPAWIELRKEIEQERETARRLLAQRWAAAGSERARTEAKAEFSAAIAALNRKIFGYNVRVPSPVLEYRALDVEIEIQSILQSG